MSDVKSLELLSIIGFTGTAINCVCLHPDEVHLLYPCGNILIISNRITREQDFLSGHTSPISCVALSPSGKYVASGSTKFWDDITISFNAPIILWDFEKRVKLSQYDIHKTTVLSLTFSCNDAYIFSLGDGKDACIVAYDVMNRKPICGGPASETNEGCASTIAAFNKTPNFFVTGANQFFRVWKYNVITREISYNVGYSREKDWQVTTIVVDSNDELAYCGTKSGVITKVFIRSSDDFDDQFPQMPMTTLYHLVCDVPLYNKGINCILLLSKGELLLGSADGTVFLVEDKTYALKKEEMTEKFKGSNKKAMLKPNLSQYLNVGAGISSMRLTKGEILIGTLKSEIFEISRKTWKLSLLSTCHNDSKLYNVEDIAFPSDSSEVFASCIGNDVHLWRTETCEELVRIKVANTKCLKILFQHDSQSIITAWNDGNIRAYNTASGELIYTIENAHMEMVRAIGLTKCGKTLLSGGSGGQVRIWDISSDVQKLKAVLKGHKDYICDIAINHAGDEAVTICDQGSCITWDIVRYKLKNRIYINSNCSDVSYHLMNSQILTTEDEEKIMRVWKMYDGELIREIKNSSGYVNTIDISPCGAYFLSGGDDKMVKVWKYDEAKVTHASFICNTYIIKARFSPDSKFIISASGDGAIFRWKNPYYQ